jgi:uncharacterized metal-binding protein YceD (DUF177 family)
VISETARLTDKKMELNEEALNILNIKFQALTEKLKNEPDVAFTYFKPDERKDGGAFIEIKGKVAYRLVGQCSRCLKNACMQVEGELDAYFEPRKDAEDYSYSGGKINLKEAVEDAVMACMPYLLLCDENCEGIRYSEEN